MRRLARQTPRTDFRDNPSLVLLYQIAETIGQPVSVVKETTTVKELSEWAFFLNSPFSNKGRELFLNAWLVQVIRSILATKTNRPKFKDSILPLDKFTADFFKRGKPKPMDADAGVDADALGLNAQDVSAGMKKVSTPTEVAHMAHVWRKRYEDWQRDYRAGKVTDAHGYYYGERV